MKRFNNLKNPSYVAVSSDERLIAYKNTSGHIAVHDLKTGELLVKSRCTSVEGNSLFFIRDDKQILSSDWDGNVFTLDVASGEFTVVCKLPVIIPVMNPTSENTFVVTGNKLGDYTCLFALSVGEEITWNKLCAIPPYRAESNGQVVSGGKVFFWADMLQGDVIHLIAYAVASDILTFDTATRELSVCFRVEDLLGLYPTQIHGYFTCMCITRDEKTLLLGTSEKIIGIDLAEKKLLGIREVKYLSSLRFMCSDTKVIIGTWRALEIVDFDTLFSS